MGTKSLPGQRNLSAVLWVDRTLWYWRPPVRIQVGTPISGPLPFQGEMRKGAGVKVKEHWCSGEAKKGYLNQITVLKFTLTSA